MAMRGLLTAMGLSPPQWKTIPSDPSCKRAELLFAHTPDTELHQKLLDPTVRSHQ